MEKPFFIFLSLLFVNCGTINKKTTYSTKKEYAKTRKISVQATPFERRTSSDSSPKRYSNISNPITNSIINTALAFSGTRYKYGGSTKRGMDCSGLLYVSFAKHDVQLPRSSFHMAEEGKKIRLRNVAKGDLLFFKTGKNARRINHVGLVVTVEGDEVKFIHASTTRGVIVSSMREGFWNEAFIKANRIL